MYTSQRETRKRWMTKRHIRNRDRFMSVLLMLMLTAITSTYVLTHVNGSMDKYDTSLRMREIPAVVEEKIEVIHLSAELIQYSAIPKFIQIPVEPIEAHDIEEPTPVEEPDDVPVILSATEQIQQAMGDATILVDTTHTLTRCATPDVYYPGVDFTRMQPYEDYHVITAKSSPAYRVTFGEGAYTDDNGFRRVEIKEGEFSIDGIPDYVVAMGTFYKPKGTCGSRFLIITDTGMFTVITGDEKSDLHTDSHNMFTWHGNGHQYAGVLEYLVNYPTLPRVVKQMGSVHYVSFAPLNGTIQMIYRIE